MKQKIKILENWKIKVFIKFKDSRHAQMPIYAVFHEEFDFPLENAQFWQLDVKNEEKRSE